MEQHFYIGQKVVANTTAYNSYGVGVVKNKTYIVIDIHQTCCGFWMVDVGLIPNPHGQSYCPICDMAYKSRLGVFVNNEFLPPIADQYADMTAEIAQSVKETREAPDKVEQPERNSHVHSVFRDMLNQLL